MSDILIRRPGESWTDPAPYAYDDEAELQALLAAHPQLIPGITPEQGPVANSSPKLAPPTSLLSSSAARSPWSSASLRRIRRFDEKLWDNSSTTPVGCGR